METNLSQASLAHVHTETLFAVPLSPAIGAEIVGLDLRAPLDDAQFEEYPRCLAPILRPAVS